MHSIRTCATGLFILILTFCANPFPGQAQDNSLNKQFESLYASLKKAIADQNKDAIAALLDSDFISIEISDTKKNADQMIAEIATVPKYLKKDSVTTVLKIEISGEVAHVTQRYHMTASKSVDDGKIHKIEVIALSNDEWERHADKWLLQMTRTDAIDMLIDGQQVAHKIRPEI
jgi:hypothetical protein